MEIGNILYFQGHQAVHIASYLIHKPYNEHNGNVVCSDASVGGALMHTEGYIQIGSGRLSTQISSLSQTGDLC